MAWHEGRPVFNRLPKDGYGNNEAADLLTDWVDQKLTNKAEQLQTLWRDLCDPETCFEEYLDYLAWLVGLSGNYWDTTWSPSIKRILIKNAHPVLWSKKGTFEVLRFVLDTHQIRYQVWTKGALVMPLTMPAVFETSTLKFYIRLPVTYDRNSTEFREAERTLKNFAPVIVPQKAVYDYFRLGFSMFGEPMFRADSFKTT